MSEQHDKKLNDLIGKTSEYWQLAFQVFEENCPWHVVLAQVMAVLGEDTTSIRYIASEVADTRIVEELTLDLVIVTDDLIVRSTLEAGGKPFLTLTPRSTLNKIVVLEAPVEMPVIDSGRRSRFADYELVYELTFGEEVLTLPFKTRSKTSREGLAELLTSLRADLLSR